MLRELSERNESTEMRVEEVLKIRFLTRRKLGKGKRNGRTTDL
jgi:hypothetical protein